MTKLKSPHTCCGCGYSGIHRAYVRFGGRWYCFGCGKMP
jgi:hypothetical protein